MRLAWGGDPDSEEAPFPEAQGCNEWHCPWRWGWAEETWKPFLEALCPPLSVLCGSFHLQPGFLMAMLGYNEERYGLDRCNMIAFYPRNSAVKEEGVRPKRKAIEQGHMADHVLASVSAVYADFRLAASKAVRKRHLFRATSREAEPLAKLVNTTARSLQASLQQGPQLVVRRTRAQAALVQAQLQLGAHMTRRQRCSLEFSGTAARRRH